MSRMERHTDPYSKAVSRRRFLRTAAWSGAALGLAGLGGFGLVARASEKPDTSGASSEETTADREDTEQREAPEKQRGKKRRGKRKLDPEFWGIPYMSIRGNPDRTFSNVAFRIRGGGVAWHDARLVRGRS